MDIRVVWYLQPEMDVQVGVFGMGMKYSFFDIFSLRVADKSRIHIRSSKAMMGGANTPENHHEIKLCQRMKEMLMMQVLEVLSDDQPFSNYYTVS